MWAVRCCKLIADTLCLHTLLPGSWHELPPTVNPQRLQKKIDQDSKAAMATIKNYNASLFALYKLTNDVRVPTSIPLWNLIRKRSYHFVHLRILLVSLTSCWCADWAILGWKQTSHLAISENSETVSEGLSSFEHHGEHHGDPTGGVGPVQHSKPSHPLRFQLLP